MSVTNSLDLNEGAAREDQVFSASQRFLGDLAKAFSLAEAALTAIGFRITKRTSDSLEFAGPGMNSSRESALVGASRIQLRGGREELVLVAELGGVERMRRFVTRFPPSLALGLGVILSVVFSLTLGPGPWIYIVFGVVAANVVLWWILGPIIARSMRARTCRGLESLLTNLVKVGESAE